MNKEEIEKLMWDGLIVECESMQKWKLTLSQLEPGSHGILTKTSEKEYDAGFANGINFVLQRLYRLERHLYSAKNKPLLKLVDNKKA